MVYVKNCATSLNGNQLRFVCPAHSHAPLVTSFTVKVRRLKAFCKIAQA